MPEYAIEAQVKAVAADPNEWLPEYNTMAMREGWAVFQTDRGPEIERDDEAGMFESDEEAVEHVRNMAQAGSALHKLALAIDESTHIEPDEGDMITRCRKGLCPICESSDVEYSSIDTVDMVQCGSCNACGAEWEESLGTINVEITNK